MISCRPISPSVSDICIISGGGDSRNVGKMNVNYAKFSQYLQNVLVADNSDMIQILGKNLVKMDGSIFIFF